MIKQTKGLMIAAPSSGQGKTLITFGLLNALRQRSIRVQPFKTGPDYIDPKFHEQAAGTLCYNLDPWAMSSDRLWNTYSQNTSADLNIVEGVMGLFDGAEAKRAEAKRVETSSAALAINLGLPVVLVVDCKGMAQSLAALVHGFKTYRPNLNLVGLILNRVGSPKHQRMLCDHIDIPVLGCLPTIEGLKLESRHLGLKQASELGNLQQIVEKAGAWITQHIDLDAVLKLSSGTPAPITKSKLLKPLGQKIAIARDSAFGFLYPHLLSDWRNQGAEISFFSPLENQAPADDADAVYLPGGYPELYAGRLAANSTFLVGIRAAKDRGAWIYGECGGFMVLGDGLIDAKGDRHKMTGILPLKTSFQHPKRHLGYRQIQSQVDTPFGPVGQKFRGHEFHFSAVHTQKSPNLFTAQSASDEDLGIIGLCENRVFGSYLHLIDAQ